MSKRKNSESKKLEGVYVNNDKLPEDINDRNGQNSSLPSIIELNINSIGLMSKTCLPAVISIPSEKRELRLLRDYQAIFTNSDASVITPCEQIAELKKIKSGHLRAHRAIIDKPSTPPAERYSRLLKEYKNMFPECDFPSKVSYDDHLDPEDLSVRSDLTTHEISCSSIDSFLPSDKTANNETNRDLINETNRDLINMNEENDKNNESLLNVPQFVLQNVLCNCF